MNIANILTITRIFMAPLFVYLLIRDPYGFITVSVFVLTSVTDALDGFIARHFRQKSNIGTLLDPVADKVLILSSYYVLTSMNKTPLWLFTFIIGKEIIVISGWLLTYILSGSAKISVHFLAKITVILQLCTILCVLLRMPYLVILYNITAAATVLSTIEYCVQGGRELTKIYVK
ncbi:MAG: CDP-alcohol phosphatidyltransferase family protein [Elusimicrobia bacterium]|nr:CDP-alcohol phosphatidyltransferase family protein [Elusimicrobiota bacterium]